ncbi:hypothetical protein ACW5W6_08005 [Aeromonas mytilicola]|uniref:hypothetical protein n=1 Tax=Aeromonas media TaxID=651 RepID=UPI0038D2280B
MWIITASIADKGHLAPIYPVMDYNTFCARNRQRWVMTVSTFYGYSDDETGHGPLMSLLSLTLGVNDFNQYNGGVFHYKMHLT